MQQQILKSLIIIAILLGLGIVIVSGLSIHSYYAEPSIKNSSLSISERVDSSVQMGDSIYLTISSVASWNLEAPKLTNVNIPESWVQVGEPQHSWFPTLSGNRQSQIVVTYRAIAPDTSHSVAPQLHFRGVGEIADTHCTLPTFEFPEILAFNVDHLSDSTPFILAEKMNEPFKWDWRLYTGIGVGSLLFIAIIILLYHAKHHAKIEKKVVIPPWITATEQLVRLRASVAQSHISPERAIVSITDIVRNYLTERFGIPASSSTTEEFLSLLALGGSPLTEEHRGFLKAFLSAAEMIKFAGMHAEDSQVVHAINQAERLVKETEPKESNHVA